MKDKKTVKLQIRLSEDELKLFKEKSESYDSNVSGMIRDAVARFDDKKTKEKIDTMTTLLKFYNFYLQRLSWLGGNFNQAQHRANELAIAGELSPDYYTNVILPKTQKAMQFLRNIKVALDIIHDKLEES